MSKLLMAYVGLEEKYELSTRELSRRAEQLRIINEIGRRILAVRHVDELLPYIARVLYETFNCYSVAVWLTDEDTRQLALAASAGGDPEMEGQDLRFSYGERSVAAWVAEHGAPLLTNDVSQEPRYSNVLGQESARSELAVPIRLADETIGVLDIEHTEEGAFDASDVDMLATVADQVALAIENARLWYQTRTMAVIEERNRLAREIHDTLAQQLTGVVLQLEAAIQQRESRPERAWERVGKALELTKEGLNDVRRSVRNLRPAPLEGRGLERAIRDELQRVESDTGATTELEIPGGLPRMEAFVEDTVYRIVQEALNNVRKHARASQVRVTIEPDGEWIRLRVRDNGIGFDPDDLTSDRRSYGIKGMRERARLVGGEVEVRGHKGRGTVVSARIPRRPEGARREARLE